MATRVKTAPKTTALPAAAPTGFIPIVEQRFRTTFQWFDHHFKTSFEAEVVILTAEEWLEFPERAYCYWGAQTLGSGMVIAVRVVPDDKDMQEICRAQDDIGDVEQIAVLRHFRSRFLGFLESDPSVSRVELTNGGDAECEFRVEFEGHDPAVIVDCRAAEM